MVEILRKKGIKVLIHKIDQKNPYKNYKNIKKFIKIFNENKISLVHARSRAPAWSSYYAAKALKIPFITTWNGHAENATFLKKKYNSVMLKGNAVIANSEYTAKKISLNYQFDINKIDIIPRGVNCEDFKKINFQNNKILNLRKKWTKNNNQKIILLPARYTRWKGHELAIKALSELSKKNANLNFSIIFVGNKKGNEKYINHLEKLSNKLGISNYLRILENFDNMPLAYLSSD